MKFKNRVLSAVMAIVASMTFVSATAFADSAVELKPSATEVKAGDTFTVEIDTTGNSGVCYLSYTVTATNSVWSLTNFADAKLFAGYVKNTKYSKETYQMDWWIDDMGEEFATDTGITGTLTYTVNENAAPGEYVINLTGKAIVDDSLMPVDFASASTTIKVVEDKPVVVEKYTLATEEDTNDPVDGYYTKGFKATVAPINGGTLKKIDYVLSLDGVEANEKGKGSFDIATNTEVSFAINVINIPVETLKVEDAAKLAINWTVTAE